MFKESTINNKTEEINKLSHSELSPEVSNHINKLWQEADVISVELNNLQNEKKTNTIIEKDTKLKNRLATILNLITASKENNSVEEERTKAEYISEEKALDEIEKLFNEGADNDHVAMSLAGLESPRAWALREKLLKDGVENGMVLRGLYCLDSPESWAMRTNCLETESDGWIIRSMAGIDSPQAWEMREKLSELLHDIVQSLAWVDSPQAWTLREQSMLSLSENNGSRRGNNTAFISSSLIGLDSPQAWEMREKFINLGLSDNYLAESLRGVNSSQAWAMRKKLLKNNDSDRGLISSLFGLDSPQAWEMREELLKRRGNFTKREIAESLVGLDSPQAWEMRERLINEVGVDKLIDFNDIYISITGLDSPQAWEMREKLSEMCDNKNWALLGINFFGTKVSFLKLKRDRELNSKK